MENFILILNIVLAIVLVIIILLQKSEGGALGIENALKTAFDWKVRKNLAAGKEEKGSKVIHFRECFHGRTGYTMSLTDSPDPRKTLYFPQFEWPRINNPKLHFPLTDEVLEHVKLGLEVIE